MYGTLYSVVHRCTIIQVLDRRMKDFKQAASQLTHVSPTNDQIDQSRDGLEQLLIIGVVQWCGPSSLYPSPSSLQVAYNSTRFK